jgi:hypothetical protein
MEPLSQSLSVAFAAHPALQGLTAIAVSSLWYFSGFQDIRRGKTQLERHGFSLRLRSFWRQGLGSWSIGKGLQRRLFLRDWWQVLLSR